MELLDLTYYDLYQGLLTVLIFMIGLIICLLLSKNIKDIKVIVSVYVWHTFFSIFYWYYTLSHIADSLTYYKNAFYYPPQFKAGTAFIDSITYYLVNILNTNYLNSTLVFNIFGALGIVFLYHSIHKYLNVLSKYWIVILFIPSMSFWSAGLGKDSIAFMAVCLFLYAVTTSKKQNILISVAFFSMFMVRPHIAFIMLVSFAIYFFLKSKIHIFFKLLILPFLLGSSVVALNFVQDYVGLQDSSLSDVGNYIEQRQGLNQEGGSSLDISSMSYPLQMFTYIFRPLPFEAHSIVALITSLENTILLLVLIFISIKSKLNLNSFVKEKNLWLFTYVFMTCSVLALITANLGIATRQKWMFMPVLIYLFLNEAYKIKLRKLSS